MHVCRKRARRACLRWARARSAFGHQKVLETYQECMFTPESARETSPARPWVAGGGLGVPWRARGVIGGDPGLGAHPSN